MAFDMKNRLDNLRSKRSVSKVGRPLSWESVVRRIIEYCNGIGCRKVARQNIMEVCVCVCVCV